MAKKIIRAAEVGFGTVSFTVSGDDKPLIKTFSSSVGRINESRIGQSEMGIGKRDTVEVEIDGELFEVGPDAYLSSQDSDDVLSDHYVGSKQYKALLKGSLSLMHDRVIDLLVVGLPVNHWSKKDELIKLTEGVHDFKGGKQRIVKKTMVLPQPVAGLVSYATSLAKHDFDKNFKTANVVCIDAGYLTLDVCTSRGLTPIEKRSGATENGFSTVLSEIIPTLSKAFSLTNNLSRRIVDDAFWKTKGKLKVRGCEYSFPVCRKEDNELGIEYDVSAKIYSATSTAANYVRNIVGSGDDIDFFVLFGGPIKTFEPAVRELYPHHKIIVLENNLTTVVEGLFYAGKQVLKG
ncbi:ParM/StbA family protein [Pseudoalteromonas nigrifaciens]|uniref:ParM/StbA family protein n=1 Tax=Pseudoalteromonas nigrifaciens TaxID=28109 RepID=UPI003FB84542